MPHRCRGGWAYVLEYGRDATGKRLQTTKAGFATKTAAQSACKSTRILMTDVSAHTLTVAQYLDTWLAGKHALRPATVAQYRDMTDAYLLPHIGHIRLLELRAHNLDRLYVTIRLGRRGRLLSPATVRRIHAVLRSALGSAVKGRLIPYNPAEHIELAPENPKRSKPWSPAEWQQFLASIAEDRLALMYELYLVTGARRVELVGLRWANLDLSGHVIAVTEQTVDVGGKAVQGLPKTKAGTRLIQLDPTTVERLRQHHHDQVAARAKAGPAWHDTEHVCTWPDGRPLRPEYVTRLFQALSATAGLRVIRLHDLRHTNASLALTAGVPLKVVSDRLGHSQTAITADLYTHVNTGIGAAAARQIAQALRTPEGRSL